jgi:hypothetical protein
MQAHNQEFSAIQVRQQPASHEPTRCQACDSATHSGGVSLVRVALDNNKPPRRIDGLPKCSCSSKTTTTRSYRMSLRRESDFERLEQLLREADERAKEANERAERERRRAEDEQRNRQEAESRAQIEGKKTDPQHSKNTYVPAIHFSRNHFVSRATRASARHALDLGECIIFENHAITLSDNHEEVRQSL